MTPGITDVPSPGGWLTLYGARVGKALVIGTVGLGAAFTVYGTFNGGQASHWCEATLTSTTANTVVYSCLNPLPEGVSGAILRTPTSGIYIARTTNPATRLNVGTAVTATTNIVGTAASANVLSGVVLEGAKRWLPLSLTGTNVAGSVVPSATVQGYTPIVLAPRDDVNGKRYLNFVFKRGSGASVPLLPSTFARIEIVPCNLNGVGC